ncbi:hypothetical protein N7539_008452 [Penicillium diatomitis]|uniref:Uncharacterized protein n=1 Tax=Penicillium diatomitis TaxID=2819901 RepID=A0A9W9WTR5_9EURO|nr:uncharacterized protein N7539_008452 [Penicillium diatomitis]KAJ5475386.1 hypothetical protein N7539_008452 [Penicillium diatomitis]
MREEAIELSEEFSEGEEEDEDEDEHEEEDEEEYEEKDDDSDDDSDDDEEEHPREENPRRWVVRSIRTSEERRPMIQETNELEIQYTQRELEEERERVRMRAKERAMYEREMKKSPKLRGEFLRQREREERAETERERKRKDQERRKAQEAAEKAQTPRSKRKADCTPKNAPEDKRSRQAAQSRGVRTPQMQTQQAPSPSILSISSTRSRAHSASRSVRGTASRTGQSVLPATPGPSANSRGVTINSRVKNQKGLDQQGMQQQSSSVSKSPGSKVPEFVCEICAGSDCAHDVVESDNEDMTPPPLQLFQETNVASSKGKMSNANIIPTFLSRGPRTFLTNQTRNLGPEVIAREIAEAFPLSIFEMAESKWDLAPGKPRGPYRIIFQAPPGFLKLEMNFGSLRVKCWAEQFRGPCAFCKICHREPAYECLAVHTVRGDQWGLPQYQEWTGGNRHQPSRT